MRCPKDKTNCGMKIKNLLLYGGVSPEQFTSSSGIYEEENRKNLFIYALVMVVFFYVLGMQSILTKNWLSSEILTENHRIYMLTAVGMGLIILLLKCSRRLSTFAVYAFIALLYFESIAITLQHPDFPAVTYIGVLLVLPLLFVLRPLSIILAQILFAFVFGFVSLEFKTAAASAMDIWNAVTFMSISVVSVLIVIPMRINIIEKTRIIRYIGEHDLLTGLRNRNAYEQEVKGWFGEPAVKCLYIDVNGLHQMNDLQGHDAGDTMLKTVAGALLARFGEKCVYRIGGDEFVIFCTEDTGEELEQKIAGITGELERYKYYISCGWAALTDSEDGMDMISKAEQCMYQDKAAYYQRTGRERRKQ